MLYILHQVNCQNSFGAGFAGYLAKFNPAIKDSYHQYVNSTSDRGYYNRNLLGSISEFESDGFTIVHCFGQQFYGNSRKTKRVYTRYLAVEDCLKAFRKLHPDDVAICPQYMGCGLAGGDWARYSELLDRYNIIPCDRIDLEHRVYHRASK